MRFRDPAKRNPNSASSNPARFVLTWKTNHNGYWKGYDREKKSNFIVRNISGIILEPSIHTVTGSNRDGSWGIQANYADKGNNSFLKVYRRDNQTKVKTLIAQGPYAVIKSALANATGEKARYTCVMWVLATEASISTDVNKAATVRKNMKEIIELNFSWNVATAFVKAAEKIGQTFDTIDGFGFAHKTNSSENDRQGIERFYPDIQLSEMPPTDPNYQAGIDAFNQVDEFLEAHWSGRTEESEAIISMDDPMPANGNGTEIEIVPEPEDDDLPF